VSEPFHPIAPNMPRLPGWRVVAAMSLCLTACGFDAKYRWKSLEAPAVSVQLDYRSQPGDRIALTFMRDLRDSALDNYHLQVGDQVEVAVQDREDLSRTSTVAPDGKIYFAYLDPLMAAGKTLKELRTMTEEKYQPTVRSARVTLVPVHFAGTLDALLQGISNPTRPTSSYETLIGLDGTAVFPQLGFVPVAGKTPQELNILLQEKYSKLLPGILITSNLQGGSSRLLTILGEVRQPGSVPVDGAVSLTQALGLAQGWLPSAHLDDIILIQKRGGKVTISKYDMQKDLMVATQLQLVGGDLIFVPRSAISDLNVFVDQYIRRNLPVAVGLSIPIPFLQN
jgi:protein involved in polysaccharide export with SLBB domain